MNQTFTFKSVLLALLMMICCTVKAEIVSHETTDGFIFRINLGTEEASVNNYLGHAANVVVPESVFYGGRKYKVTSLGRYCFALIGRLFLVSIEIPSSVTSLGQSCFEGCRSLASIEIPCSVTSIGERCFWDCSSLVSINIPSSVTSMGDCCFQGCSSLASIAIPSSVTSMGDCCFQGCSSLASIDIPSSVTSLGSYCFSNCSSLASIDIPSSVTSIGERCFWDCSSLKTVTCRMKNIVRDAPFFNTELIKKATLYVPKSRLFTYRKVYPWNYFGTIRRLGQEN